MTSEPRHSDLPASGIPDGGTSGGSASRLVTPAVWTLALALAAVAPLLDLYSFGGGLFVDGFGREHFPSLGSNGVLYGGSSSGEHTARLGIALLIAAALLLVGVGTTVVRPGRLAALLGVVGSVAVVFAALSVLLDAQAAVSGNNRHIDVTLGAGAWLAFAAGVVGVIGVVLAVRDVLRAD